MKKLYKLLVEIREIEERQRKRELFTVISQRVEKENEIRNLENRKGEVASHFTSSFHEGVPAFFLAHFLDYIDDLREKKKKKEKELREIVKMEDEARDRYMEAKRELEIAEKLIQRIKSKEIREKLRKEENFSDEMVVIKKAREDREE